uniref:Retrotransposon protein n=1 Tax=Haemonchus placei TaxID=6290 RepID=A0A0N4WNP1_HAEPC
LYRIFNGGRFRYCSGFRWTCGTPRMLVMLTASDFSSIVGGLSDPFNTSVRLKVLIYVSGFNPIGGRGGRLYGSMLLAEFCRA